MRCETSRATDVAISSRAVGSRRTIGVITRAATMITRPTRAGMRPSGQAVSSWSASMMAAWATTQTSAVGIMIFQPRFISLS